MSTPPALYPVILAAVAIGWRVVKILWFPLTGCRRCKGDGKHRDWTGRHWRLCRRCRGTGTRVRLGRVVLDKMRTARAKARKAA